MTDTQSAHSEKKVVRIDISSDTVCPWCFVGKKNLDKAIASSKDKYNFEVSLSLSLTFCVCWGPFFLSFPMLTCLTEFTDILASLSTNP